MKNLRNALVALGINGKVQLAQYQNIIKVIVNSEYFGLWDINKNTFVD